MTPSRSTIDYPDSDGEPMADNTLQWEWIAAIRGNLDAIFVNDPDVFVASDLLWYPVEGDNTTRTAPDAMVAFGRPKGYRGSYRQWVEDNIAPQVVFEILSPGNRPGAMGRKFEFYRRHGVEEYYIYDPDDGSFQRWHHGEAAMTDVAAGASYTSPRLRVRFEPQPGGQHMVIYRPDGRRFLTYAEMIGQRERADLATQLADITARLLDSERLRADMATRILDAERSRADMAARLLDAAESRAERLAAKLRELGIELPE